MKNTIAVSFDTVYTHAHTQGVLTNKKVKNRINKIKKDSKNLVFIDNTR